MNTSTISDSEQNTFQPPQWLQACLLANGDPNHQYHTEDNRLICQAYEFAYELHKQQTRKSGEPYIVHPVAVAGLLRDLGGDSAMIAAGFLHDVVEDTEVSLEEIESRFGEQVRQLVEGVTKLSKFEFSSKTERQAENFRRMFLAMAKDIRVIVVKLADRLHNMRTLQHLSLEKQQAIALETKEIFAPLANRLGIGRLKWELEDLSFKYLEPEAYRTMQNHIAEKRTDREARIEKVTQLLKDRLQTIGIKIIEIQGRPKHLYGIYQKMCLQQKQFNEIYDIAGLRLIVDNKEECYRALAIVHDTFRPIPGRFKDYIGLPKSNRYQSLHTSVVGLNGRPLEVQIRTLEMHQVAEYGIAAHWKYKESGGSNQVQVSSGDEKFTWLRQLLEWQNDLKDAQEYIDSLRDNLFEDDVYVFTPQGDVMVLARGATPVDFAYRIHTEIGNHIKGAKVNGRWSVLDCSLENGDIVEIITSKNSHPSLDWLNFVVTPTARNRIRQWYKRSHNEENVARGRELLERELGKGGLEALLKSPSMQSVAQRCNYQKVEDLLAALGYGEITVSNVVNRLREIVKDQQSISKESNPELTTTKLQETTKKSTSVPVGSQYPIIGVEGLLYHLAGCCQPIPGEKIIGVVTRNARGIAIHNQNCPNIEGVEGDRLIPVSWNTVNGNGRPHTYPVDLAMEVIDRVGVFKDILSRLSDQNINVRNAGVKTSWGKPAMITLSIEVINHRQLESTISQIKNMSDVLNLRRLNQLDEL
ncbi:bifunctional (p)ppGpp synthetase/guanosine-3',5'-bis(diphosphate) 3'-pyrophosphohydrolase [Gloeocapsa sp. PCC 73106]|uniref:RelA/SpoT family protein n=1 Tax=Gloeocapsa sp. PCC 73106 TaxID=102232 RepID=UPI0002AC4341|nr:bifunctional (p)ppGpp synthetase/guanosine-3',5'-bis(diphosphate) 3'-pyrophosphohydrolase [Gloeocapsa sp. PCC 73106]ELR98001.1 (p)ppGpp synthetase, RelA/SpoT family [Gloeocapsa sp. PCC 73106]